MLWEVEIQPRGNDPERLRIVEEYDLIAHARESESGQAPACARVVLRHVENVPPHRKVSTGTGADLVAASARGFLLEGELSRAQVERLLAELLLDPLVEIGRVRELTGAAPNPNGFATVLYKPGVMDPVAMSVVQAARDLDIPVESVRTFRRYFGTLAEPDRCPPRSREILFGKVLANEAVEQVVIGPLSVEHLALGTSYSFRLATVPLGNRDDDALEKISRQGQLSLSRAEMRSIQEHFERLGRDPTDVELETLAQTWSEHCSHKTLKGKIDFDGRRIDNLLKETIFEATQEIRRRLGANDWCVSVFEDNAGVVRFDDRYHVCFKVETHNHPSALEPYGGANTGVGGVIRDPMGTGLGAKPVCNTDVFCFAPPDMPAEALPPGVLHPKKIMKGVVAGVRDYGNRMGIPTVNGAVCFDERYLANPLVYCGTVGLIPVERCRKEAKAGDLIVVLGGRTGRDGIHGATFSSVELTSESERISGGAVQIGNAIVEKKMLDVLLEARDRELYHAVTDCGAGGFSSAVGEMAEKLGASVQLDQAPLKYEGLSHTEIWISESQERMVLAVPPERWNALQELCRSEDVESAVLGRFEATGRLRLYYQGNQAADLDLDFLHHGRPPVVRQATWTPAPCAGEKRKNNSSTFVALGLPSPPVSGGAPRATGMGVRGGDVQSDPSSLLPEILTPLTLPVAHGAPPEAGGEGGGETNFTKDLLQILSCYNVCGKEWIIRQYDHEVQGGSVLKPLVGVHDDGPGDAAVIVPVLGSWTGLALGCGINPRYGALDPYAMAAAAVDEAVRNVGAVGADPERIALLDNFCWGNTDRPEVLGSLVRAAEACRDVALAYGTPFISGKDSLNNEYHAGDRHIVIPPTLLISALGRVPDVRRCVSMDLKEPGNFLFFLGATRNEMGGSHFHFIHGVPGGIPPRVDLELAPRLFRKLHAAITRGLVRSCHDLSEGGLGVALAEMAFAGGVGADITGLQSVAPHEPDEVLLFAESTTRFIIEVAPAHVQDIHECFGTDVPLAKIGQTCKEPRLRIAGTSGAWIVWAELADLKEAWQKPLRW